MGDINLLGMIRKIKNSISGFVSTSDKATKSKFGIVKVGEGINVASGVISVSNSGFDVVNVITQTDIAISADNSIDIPFTLPDISNKHFAVISGRMYSDDWDFGMIVPISIFIGNKRIGIVEVASVTGNIKIIVVNASQVSGSSYNLRIGAYTQVTAGRITVDLI